MEAANEAMEDAGEAAEGAAEEAGGMFGGMMEGAGGMMEGTPEASVEFMIVATLDIFRRSPFTLLCPT